MFDDSNLTLISDVDQDTWMFGFHLRSQMCQCLIS